MKWRENAVGGPSERVGGPDGIEETDEQDAGEGSPDGAEAAVQDPLPTDDVRDAMLDTDRPSPSRVFDAFLGGAHNYAADRQYVERLGKLTPDIGATIRASRAFLRRALRLMLDEGIDQFLDLGCGIPTVGSMYDLVRQVSPDVRIVAVDIDPLAVSHTLATFDGDPNATAFQDDIRAVGRILAHPEAHRLLDLSRPVGVLMVGVLHFISDADDPPAIVARVRDAIPSGSFVVVLNLTSEAQPPEVFEAQHLSKRTGIPLIRRTRAELTAQYDGLRALEPGLVYPTLWRPDVPFDEERPERFGALAVVTRKD